MSAWHRQRTGGPKLSLYGHHVVLGTDAPTFESDCKRNFTRKVSDMGSDTGARELREQTRRASPKPSTPTPRGPSPARTGPQRSSCCAVVAQRVHPSPRPR